MKKKIISFVLLVVMISSLLCVSAYAQPAVGIVTLANGDTVFSLCQKYGISYNTYKTLIMALNCVTDESQFGRMPVGSQIVLPINDAAAAAISGISSGSGSTTVAPGINAGTTLPQAPQTPVAGAATSVPAGDTVSCYVISYKVQSKDTISGIYRARDLSYKTYTNLILKLNNLSSLNSLKVGRTYLLPVAAPIQGDTVEYTVMRHTMQSGETVYGVVSTGYGLKYKDNQEMLKTINGKDNLGSFKVGEGLLIAVKGYVQPTIPTAGA